MFTIAVCLFGTNRFLLTCCASWLTPVARKDMKRTYADVLDTVQAMVGKKPNRSTNNIMMTTRLAERLGLTPVLENMKFIHVTGTKGKGSTCTFASHLLEGVYGKRVGLFTSPHLVDVRERIQINNKLLPRERFTEYFFTIHDAMARIASEASSDLDRESASRSNFFRFMFLLSLHTFREEKVDVAIMEVGIGGRIDSTNIIPRPAACGIAAIGMDHMELLGNTVEEIAVEKCGIMKKGVPCMVSLQKLHPGVMATIEAESRRHEAPLVVVDPKILPNFRRWPALAMGGDHIKDNSYLALALARAAMDLPITLPIHPLEAQVLSRVVVEGRSQVIPFTKTMLANVIDHVTCSPIATPRTTRDPIEELHRRKVGEMTVEELRRAQDAATPSADADGLEDGPTTNGARLTFADPKECLNTAFYLDGAHNPESMEVMARWFFKEQLAVERLTAVAPEGRRIKNVLVIYSTRAPLDILRPLIPYASLIDAVIFTLIESPKETQGGAVSEDHERLLAYVEAWRNLFREIPCYPCSGPFESLSDCLSLLSTALNKDSDSAEVDESTELQRQFGSASCADGDAPFLRVLVTGSILFAGDFLKLIKKVERRCPAKSV